MDFAQERYVRLYTRDTTGWKLLGWQGQTVFSLLYRKADRGGVIKLEGLEPWELAVVHCGLPEEVARAGMAPCLKRGWLVVNGDQLVFPKYVEANETATAGAQRVREHRERAKLAAAQVAPESPSNETLQPVTIGNSVPCRAVLKEENSHNRASATRGEQEPSHSDKLIGNDFMLSATNRHWQGYDSDLCLIGMKPAHERERALAAIAADPWEQANLVHCSPKHVLRKWNSLSSGSTQLRVVGNDGEASERAAARVRAEEYSAKGKRLMAELAGLKPLVAAGDRDAAARGFELETQLAETKDLFERAKRASRG